LAQGALEKITGRVAMQGENRQKQLERQTAAECAAGQGLQSSPKTMHQEGAGKIEERNGLPQKRAKDHQKKKLCANCSSASRPTSQSGQIP